jgi:hypothetical protein
MIKDEFSPFKNLPSNRVEIPFKLIYCEISRKLISL